MTDKNKDKSVKDTLKALGAKTLPAKPGKGVKEEIQKIPRDFYNKDVDNEEIPRMLKLKKGGSTNWIQKAIKKPGALKKSLGVPMGKKISPKKLSAAAKKPGKMGQRARLAQTLKKMK